MTTHLIYHGNCYDGFGAAWAAWKKYGPNIVYQPGIYGQGMPAFPRAARVVIADFSYPRHILECMRGSVESLIILDHHKTAEEDLRGFPGATFDMNRSGAALAWEYFHPDSPAPKLIRYIEDRDLWRFALPQSREVSAYLQSFEYRFEQWDDVALRLEDDFDMVAFQGSAILRAKEQMVLDMAKQAFFRNIGGYEVPVANASVYFSEVGEALCIKYPQAPFAAYYFDRSDGRRQWGLRSKNGFDVSAVAKKLGGGGHPAAAGFTEVIPW